MGDDGWTNLPNFISKDTIKATVEAITELKSHQEKPFAVVLHGGEPLLLGPRRLEYLLSSLRTVLPERDCISIQTNGMLITEEILDTCSSFQTSLSVSLDGPRHIHDKHRIGHRGEGTFHRVIDGIEKLKNHPNSDFLFAGTLAVIDTESDPSEIYTFFKSIGAPNVDFLHKDGNHDLLPPGKASFESAEYGDWLASLLDLYLSDPEPIEIRVLDDLIRLVLGGSGVKEGLGITDFGIVIIDTDGTITKNDTLKSCFSGADKFCEKWNVNTHRLIDIISSDEFASYHALQQPSSPICLNCPELKVCGGGMPLHRWQTGTGFANPSVYCADQLRIIKSVRSAISR